MIQSNITYRVAGISDPAGKFNPDAPYQGNEDNYLVIDSIDTGSPDNMRSDQILDMGPLGCLMAVADGMGGANAGEVASEIAISIVRRAFESGRVTPEIAGDQASRRGFLEQIIRDADAAIKADSASNPEHKDMGSTLIMAWIVGRRLTLTWIGDSRAYRYSHVNGLEPLSTDHSYVQELVNKGVITYDDTFEHPQGNIITRSLGDPSKDAVPESRDFLLYSGDIILLCSDGLSGVLRDKLTYDRQGVPFAGDNIQDTIADHSDDLTDCMASLMEAAKNADWYDNVTVLLCQIVGGAPVPIKHGPEVVQQVTPVSVPQPAPSIPEPKVKITPQPVVTGVGTETQVRSQHSGNTFANYLWIIIVGATLTIMCIAGFFIYKKMKADKPEVAPPLVEIVNQAPSTEPQRTPSPEERRLEQLREQFIRQVKPYLDTDLEDYADKVIKKVKKADLKNAQTVALIQNTIVELHARKELIDVLGKIETDNIELKKAIKDVKKDLTDDDPISKESLMEMQIVVYKLKNAAELSNAVESETYEEVTIIKI